MNLSLLNVQRVPLCLTEHTLTDVTVGESIAESEVQSIDLQQQQPEREEPAQATDSVDDDG